MPVQPLPLVDLGLGVILIAAIGLAASSSLPAARGHGWRLIGWVLVAVPLPLVVSIRFGLPSAPLGGQTAFVVAVVAFAVGALLVLCHHGDTKDDVIETGPDPAPWQDFERQFRAYARTQSRRRVRI